LSVKPEDSLPTHEYLNPQSHFKDEGSVQFPNNS